MVLAFAKGGSGTRDDRDRQTNSNYISENSEQVTIFVHPTPSANERENLASYTDTTYSKT